MNINELEEDIKKHKERSPESFNEIINITIPFYMFHRKIFDGICKLQEERYQLTNSELDVLTSLKISDNRDFILSPTRLNERLLFTSGAITKILKKLEEKKYIKRLDNKFDKRSKLVQLTPLGEEVAEKALKDVLNLEEKYFDALSTKEKKLLKELFVKMLKNI